MADHRKNASSCTVCRQRKVKCDQQLPCRSCIRHKAPNQCSYERPGRVSNVGNVRSTPNLTSEISRTPQIEIEGSKTPKSFNGLTAQKQLINGSSSAHMASSGLSMSSNGFNMGSGSINPRSDTPRSTLEVENTSGALFPGEIRKEKQLVAVNPSLGPVAPPSAVFLGPNSNIKLLSRFKSINEVVAVNPVLDANEIINFSSKYSTLAFDPVTWEEVNHGVFSWHALVRSDPGLAQIWNFLYDFTPLRTVAGNASVNVPNVYSKGVQKDPTKLQFLDLIRRYQATKIDPQSFDRAHRIPLGLTFNDPNPENLHIDISEQLEMIMPPSHVAERHIERFFRVIYPFFPFLDEAKFRADTARVLGLEELDMEAIGASNRAKRPKHSQKRRKFGSGSGKNGLWTEKNGPNGLPHASTPNDLATMGLFCIVLRLSYLSLLSNVNGDAASGGGANSGGISGTTISGTSFDPNPGTSSGTKFGTTSVYPASAVDGINSSPSPKNVVILQEFDLLKLPIGIEMVDLAQRCLDHYQKSHHYNLQVLQLLAYMRIYQELSPENTDGPSRDVYQLNNALLVQTAQMIGLHRAPYGSQAGVRRRLWCYILYKDVVNALKFGSNFHSEIPADCTLDMAARDLPSVAMEPVEDLTAKMRAVSKCLVQLEGTEAGKLISAVNDLERCLYSMGTLQSFSPDDTVACVRVQYQVPVHVALMTLYFRLFGHYEAQNHHDLAFFYCKKIMYMITQTFVPRVGEILLTRHTFFDYALQLVANPVFENYMQRSVGFISAWMVRLGNRVMEGLDKQYRVRAFMQSLHTAYKVCLFGILKMNHRYCYAWRVGIIYSYILSCVSSQDFYTRSLRKESDKNKREWYEDKNKNEKNEDRGGSGRDERVARRGALAGQDPPPDSIIRSCEMVFSNDQMEELINEIAHVSSSLPSQYSYWHLVSDVVKFRDDETARLYDPSKSPLVFEIEQSDTFQDLDLDWFPESAVNFNHMMESLFEYAGPSDPMSIFDFGVND